jgi:hypothetical protein
MRPAAGVQLIFGALSCLHMRFAITLFTCFLISTALWAQPVNDEPCDALPLMVSEDCTFITVDNTGGSLTASVPIPYCGQLTLSDVWYTIAVPATGLLTLSTSAGTITDAAMAVYSAPTCTGPFTLITCDDDHGPGYMPGIVLTSLVPGTTLYVRAWAYGDSTGTYELCAHAPVDLPAGDCVYMLELTDGFGDGWGDGGSVEVSINGSTILVDSLEDGWRAIHVFGVQLGDAVVVECTAGETFNLETGVRLSLLGNGIPLVSVEGLYTGVVYAAVADCMPPPPTPGDCPYAAPICGDTTFLQGAMTGGYSVDLSLSNRGCLIAGEQQGIWTQFMAATDGSLAFTLTPPVNYDIDFAIWGPLDSIACPPSGTPLRCSYASGPSTLLATGSYAVGLSAQSSDDSESDTGDGWVNNLDVQAGEHYLLYITDYNGTGLGADVTWQLTGGATLDCPLPPEADLSVSESLIAVGGSVDLTDLSSNDPSTWYWSFPGGSPSFSVQQDPTGITYDEPGCYDVSLVASNADGSGSTAHVCAVQVDVNTGIAPATDEVTVIQNADGITLYHADAGPMEMTLFDALGRILLSGRGNDVVHISSSGIADGRYVLVVQDDRKIWTRQVVFAE